MSRGRARALILLATLAGLVLRLGVALLDPIPPQKDAADYHALAVRLARGEGYVSAEGAPTAFRPPGFPAFLAAVYRLAGEDAGAGRVAQAVISACLVPLVALLAWRAGGPAAGAVAGGLAALYPGFVSSWFGPRALLIEPLLTTLVFAAMALAVEAGAGPRPALVCLIAGVVAGLAALTRGTVLFLPLLLALFAGRTVRPSGAKAHERARAALWPLLGAALVLAPWALRNRLALGEVVAVSTNGGISLWASYNPLSRGLGNAGEGYTAALAEDDQLRRAGQSEPARSRHFADKALAEIRARPVRAARLVLRKALLWADPTYQDWTRAVPRRELGWGYAALLPLALGGLLCARHDPTTHLVVAAALVLSVLHVLVHTDTRYRITAEPALVLLAALFLCRAHAWLGARRLALGALAWAAVVAALATGYDHVFAALSLVARGLGLG